MVGSEFAAFVPRGAEAFERRGRCFIIPRGSPLVDDGGIFEEAVDFRRGGVAENVDLEGLRRAANERQRHHSIAEMVEFDDEETRFHRKILTAARRSRRYLKPTRFRPLWSLCRCEKNFFFRGSIVVVTRLQNHKGVGFDFVNQAVFLIDATGPPTGKVAFEGFGFSGSGERFAGCFLDQAKDFFGESRIRGNPVLKVFKRLRLKFQAHA